MSIRSKVFAALFIGLAAWSTLGGVCRAEVREVVPWESPGWSGGPAPFGTRDGGCGLNATVRTDWPLHTSLSISHPFVVPSDVRAIGGRASFAFDNDLLSASIDGVPIAGFVQHEGCASRDTVSVSIPENLLVSGSHTFSAQFRDRGGLSFADASLSIEVETLQAPSVVFAVRTTGGMSQNNFEMEQAFVLTARIANPNSVTIQVNLKLDEFFTVPVFPVMHQQSEHRTESVTLGPHETRDVHLATLQRSWTWLDGDGIDQGAEALVSFYQDFTTELSLDRIKQLAPRAASAAGHLLTLLDLWDRLTRYSLPRTTINYSLLTTWSAAGSSSPQTGPSGFQPVLLEVPQWKKNEFFAWVGWSTLGSTCTGTGMGMTVAFLLSENPAAAMAAAGYFACEYLSLEVGLVSWRQAQDPPSDQFGVVVEPAPIELPELATLEGPWRAFALEMRRLHALKRAEAESRDRALGARLAGAAEAESRQWAAVGRYAAASALSLGRVRYLIAAVKPWLGQTADPGRIAEHLASHGLPAREIQHLSSIGWTPQQLAALAEALRAAALSEVGRAVTDPEIIEAASLIGTLVDIEAARTAYGEAVRTGGPARELTAAEQAELQALVAKLQERAVIADADAALPRILEILDTSRNFAGVTPALEAVWDNALAAGLESEVGFAALRAVVRRLIPAHGPQRSLLAKVDTAEAKFFDAKPNYKAASNILQAMLNELKGKELDPAAAAVITREVTDLMGVLGL